jgi:hypothetical protein
MGQEDMRYELYQMTNLINSLNKIGGNYERK